MGGHEFTQDPSDQFGHAQPLVERIVPEPEADAARDDHRELHRFRFPGALLFLGEDKGRLPHRFLRHAGPSACIDSAGVAVSAGIDSAPRTGLRLRGSNDSYSRRRRAREQVPEPYGPLYVQSLQLAVARAARVSPTSAAIAIAPPGSPSPSASSSLFLRVPPGPVGLLHACSMTDMYYCVNSELIK